MGRREGEFRADLSTQSGWSDGGPVNGKRWAARFFDQGVNLFIKEEVGKERLSPCRWREAEAR